MKMKANSGIKMLNDLIDETMNEKEIKLFNDYCKKLNEAQRKEPFIVVSKELMEQLNYLQ